MDERIFTVTAQEDGQRLDKLICLHFPDLTRSAVQKHIENENVSKTKLLIFLFEPAASAVFSSRENPSMTLHIHPAR